MFPPRWWTWRGSPGARRSSATDAESIKQVFRHIDKMKPAKFKQPGTMPLDHLGPLLAALMLAGVHLLGMLGARYTPW